jgi:phospholipid/cholesterol/gamma-HCH transport system substrate-binding protein
MESEYQTEVKNLMTMKKVFTKEVAIGLISIISLIVLYFGVNYLKGVNIFKPTNHYYVVMKNVPELQSSSPIYVNGFKIGVVHSIDYGYNEPGTDGHIVVLINLDEKMKIEKGSYMVLKSGLTSGAYMDLMLNKYVSAYCAVGDTIEGIANVGMMEKVENLMPQVEQILPRLDSILTGIQTLVNHPALAQSLDHIEATTAGLQRSSNQLNALLAKDVPAIMNNLQTVSSNFAVVSANLKDIDMKGTMTKVDQAIGNIDKMSQQLNSKDNSMGLLLNDKALYENLDSTAKNASDLMLDLRENPKRYVHFSVFGKK